VVVSYLVKIRNSFFTRFLDRSVRELYNTLDHLLQGSDPIWPTGGPGPGRPSGGFWIPGIRLLDMMLAMKMIGEGNWGGPATNASLSYPVSFRDSLAAAAL
jgi:hypothetical protein